MLAKKDDAQETRIIFHAYTPYHLFTSAYYAMQVRWKSNVKKYLIWRENARNRVDLSFLSEYFEDIIVLPDPAAYSSTMKRRLRRCMNGGRLFRWSEVGKLLSAQKCRNIFICFSDQDGCAISAIKMLKKHEKNIICMVDEGEATYAFQKTIKQNAYKRIIKAALLGLKQGPYIGHSGQCDAWIVRHPAMLPEKKSLGAVVVKQNDIFTDFDWVHKFDFLWKKTGMPLSKTKIILWIGGPIEVDGVGVDEEISWLKKAADAVQNDYTIFIKLHYREQTEKFKKLIGHPGVVILDTELKWIPLEFFVQLIDPDILLTVSSSAAFHIYEMGFKGKVIYCYKPFANIRIDKNVLKAYIENKNIYDIASIEELKNVIYNLPLKERTQLRNNTNEDLRYFEAIQNM